MPAGNYYYQLGKNSNGSRIVWKEISTSGDFIDPYQMLDKDEEDVIRKALEVGIEFPVRKDNAVRFDLIIERIITNLTYSL